MIAIVLTIEILDRGRGASIVLADLRLVLGNVKTGCIGQVEDVEFVLRPDLFRNFEALAVGEIEALLSTLAEDIALACIESRLIDIRRIIASGNRDTVRAGGKVADGDLRGVNRRNVVSLCSPGAEGALVARQSCLWDAWDP